MSSPGTVLSLQSNSQQGTLQVVSGSEYLKRQEEAKHTWAVRLGLPITVLWLASLIIGLGILAVPITRRMGLADVSLPSWTAGLALVLLLLDAALLPVLERLLDERDKYGQGLRGEEATAKALQQHLDSRWTLFRNVVLPGNQSDIDGVLVGPARVFVLEIKSYSGWFKNRGDGWWWRRYQPRWQRLSGNPSKQALTNAKLLSEYLRQAIGEKVWVERRVVWAGPGKLHLEGTPAVFVWFLHKIATYDELIRVPTRPADTMQRVRGALVDVVEAPDGTQDARVGRG